MPNIAEFPPSLPLALLTHLSQHYPLASATAMKGGLSNSLFHVITKDGNPYVLRVFDSNTARFFGINRTQEIAIQKVLQRYQLAPRIRTYDLDFGYMLMDYIPAISMTASDFSSRSVRKEFIRTLVYMHRLPIPKALGFSVLDPYERSLFYIQQLPITPLLTSLSSIADIFFSILHATPPTPIVLCHHDVHFGNILMKNPLMFVDFEYASLGNPLFDLAMFCESAAFNEPTTRLLWRLYHEKSAIYPSTRLPPLSFGSYFRALRFISCYLGYLWYSVMLTKNAMALSDTQPYHNGQALLLSRMHQHILAWVRHEELPYNLWSDSATPHTASLDVMPSLIRAIAMEKKIILDSLDAERKNMASPIP